MSGVNDRVEADREVRGAFLVRTGKTQQSWVDPDDPHTRWPRAEDDGTVGDRADGSSGCLGDLPGDAGPAPQRGQETRKDPGVSP